MTQRTSAFRFSLVWRVMASLLLVGLIPVGALGYVLRQRIESDLTTSAQNSLNQELKQASQQITDFVDAHTNALKTTATLAELTGMDGAAQTRTLTPFAAQPWDFSDLFTTDVKGDNVARTDGAKFANFADRVWFTDAMKGADHAYQTLVSKTSNKPVLTIAVPIKAKNAPVGVLAAHVTLDRISEMVGKIKVGRTGFAWMVDTDNKVMAHPDRDKAAKQEDLKAHEAVKAARAGQQKVTSFTENGKRWLAAQTVLPEGWVLVIQIEEAEVLQPIQAASNLATLMIVAAAVFAILVSLLVSGSLTRPVKRMGAFVAKLAGGDFSAQLSLKRTDELGAMADGLRRMQAYLRDLVASVQSSAASVSRTADHLSAAAATSTAAKDAIATAFGRTLADVESATERQKEQLNASKRAVDELVAAIDGIAQATSHQATEVGEAGQVVTDVTGRFRQVAEGVNRVVTTVEQVSRAAANGQSTVETAMASIASTKESVDSAAATVHELGTRSEAIGQILNEITAIAAQTNLLALNAAIEAARAGEHGRGFAVVAEEVRKLADRSIHSASEISSILAAIQDEVSRAVAAMGTGTVAAADGETRIRQAFSALSEIRGAVSASSQETSRIREAAESLESGHEQLAKTFEVLAAVTEENSASTQQMAAGSETVRGAVRELDTLALQSFAAIQGVTGELERIAAATERMANLVKELEEVKQSLTGSLSSLVM